MVIRKFANHPWKKVENKAPRVHQHLRLGEETAAGTSFGSERLRMFKAHCLKVNIDFSRTTYVNSWLRQKDCVEDLESGKSYSGILASNNL